MNVLLWLRMPWFATHRSARWLAVLIVSIVLPAAIAINLLLHHPDRWKGVLMVLVVGEAFLWAFFLPATLLLALDARTLRIPSAQRHVVASLLLYGAISVIMPTLWLGTGGAPPLTVAAVLALCVGGGLTFATAPRYVAMLLGFGPALFNALRPAVHLGGLDDQRTTGFVLAVALVLLATAVWRARRLLVNGDTQPRGWSSSMVLQMRVAGWSQLAGAGDSQALRHAPDWLRATPDMAGAGPDHPHRAMRMALGGVYVPQTWRGVGLQLLGLGLGFAFMMVISLLGALGARNGHFARDVFVDMLHLGLRSGLGMLSLVGGTMSGFMALAVLNRRWKGASTELSLLALLPKLGDGLALRRSVVRACLSVPLFLQGLTLVAVLACMALWPQQARIGGFALLSLLGTTAITTALVVNILGGHPLGTWRNALMLGLGQVLTFASVGLPWLAWNQHVGWAGALLSPLLLGWLLLIAAMAWLARRGWHGLRQLPHPFLAQPG